MAQKRSGPSLPSQNRTSTMKRRSLSECPICYSLDVFGDKWTLIIIRDILVYGKRRYGDFLKSDEGISTNILADRLKNMVEYGLVTRQDDPDNRTQALYSPTQKALELGPVLDSMMAWGLANGPDHLHPPRLGEPAA
jgi:DNA-binding HxlR family transcriptional regulator